MKRGFFCSKKEEKREKRAIFYSEAILFQKNCFVARSYLNKKRPWSSVDDTRSKILFSDKIYN